MKVIIAGGGTAGHINPGIAIAKKIQKEHPKAEILFVGTHRGLERNLVPKEGFHIEMITVSGFRRKLSMDTFKSVKELFQGLYQANQIIRKFRPDLVIGTGGYVCGPVVFQAAMMNIPTMLHEQNVYPSVTNRILSRFVRKIAISFEECTKYFTSKVKDKLILTGNPIRPQIFETTKKQGLLNLGFVEDKPVILVFGGSQGAEKINEAVIAMIEKIVDSPKVQILFSVGQANYDRIMETFKHKKVYLPKEIKVVPYIYNMNDALAAADLAIVRAGALTIAELTALGIPSIMIPLPSATNNHQYHNAKVLEKQGAALLIEQKHLSGQILYDKVMHLVKDRSALEKMGINSKCIGITNADKKIYEVIEQVLSTE